MFNPRVVQEWYTSLEFVTQSSHFFGGATIVLLSLARGLSGWMAYGLLLLWAIPKEYVWDLLVEQDTLKSSSLDFSLYLVGGALALLAVQVHLPWPRVENKTEGEVKYDEF